MVVSHRNWSASLGRLGRVTAALTLSAAFAAQAQTWVVSENLEVATVADGVWVHTSWGTLTDGSRFPSNGLIVRDHAGLTLVDTAWGIEPTDELLQWTESALGARITRALITHHHDDRLSGAPALAARGIPFYGVPLTRRLVVDAGMPLPESLGELRTGEAMETGVLEVFYPGPGHAADNLVVWVPSARVLFGGCAIRAAQTTALGNTADADLVHWPEAIRSIQARYPSVVHVVPGHGPVGDRSLLSHTLGLLEARAR